jgi:uridylate kinase
MTARKPLDRYRRIVIKIGSALLVDRKTGLKKPWLDGMCADIAALKAKGVDVLVVSSGRNRARAHRARPALRRAEARGKPGRRRRGADFARTRLVGKPVPHDDI